MKTKPLPDHIKPIDKISPEDYMRDRVIYKMQLYESLGKRDKRYFQWFSTVGIILSASVPVLIKLDFRLPAEFFFLETKDLAIAVSLLVTILAAIERLYHFREHWRNYDTIAANLRQEQLHYQNRTGPYKDKTDECAFARFVQRIEDRIAEERNETIAMRTSDKDSAAG